MKWLAILLTVAFVVLKLTGATIVASWSWWQVFLPIIIYYTLTTLFWTIILICKVIADE